MERLIVKNFGPLKDIDIELNKINLFIGENGSGKSVLAKIVTIVTDIIKYFIEDEESINKRFFTYNINFIRNESIIIFYKNEEKLFSLENQKIHINHFHKYYEDIDNKLDLALKENKTLVENNSLYKALITGSVIQRYSSQYIPAERNFISLFNRSISSILVAEVPLPKFLLSFMSEFEKAGNKLKELEFLNVKYINGDGLDRHKVYFNDKDYLPLEFSSSGIQSALPLYLTIKYFSNRHSSIIIEEPEQNLFPKAQAKTIKYIIEQISDDNSLFMMTHSPYVLSTLNNLIMAYKVAQLGEKEKKLVETLIPKEQWINPNKFSAYYLEDGTSISIKSDIGLIDDNEIDEISEEMGEEFDELLEIYRASKNG